MRITDASLPVAGPDPAPATPAESGAGWEDVTIGPLLPRLDELPDDGREPTTLEQLDAGLRLHNPVTGWMQSWANPAPNFTAVEGYNPYDEDLRDYSDALDAFQYSRSPEETAWIRSRVDEERRWRESAGIMGEAFGALTNPAIWLTGAAAGAAGLGLGATALAEGGAEVATEAMLHRQQYTRTMSESAINVAAAMAVPTILGAAFVGLDAAATRRFNRALADDLAKSLGPAGAATGPAAEDFVVRSTDAPDSAGAAAAFDATREDLGLSGGWAERWLGAVFGEERGRAYGQWLVELNAIGPGQRALQSASETARKVMTQMADLPFIQRAQVEGRTTGQAVEARLREYDGMYATAQLEHDRIYGYYRANGGTLKRDQFAEAVTAAMRRGDTDPDPFITRAAKVWRKPLNEVKARAIALDLLPEDVKTKFARGYVPRKYRFADPTLASKMRSILTHLWSDKMDPVEAASFAEEAVLKMGRGETDIPGYITIAPHAGATKERTFAVADTVLERWGVVDNDIRRIARGHLREMGRDIEMSRTFGREDKHLARTISQVKLEYGREVDAAKSERAKRKLAREERRTLAAIRTVRDRILGTEGRPDNPEEFINRAERTLRAYNMSTMLGGAGMSSIPEFGRVVMRKGFANLGRALHSFTSTAMRDLSKRELAMAGSAVENVLNSRAAAMSDLATDIEAGLPGALTRGMAKYSGLTAVTNVQQDLAGHLTMHGILTDAVKVAKSARGAQAAATRLAKVNIDASMARRIGELHELHARKVGTLQFPDTASWVTEEVVELPWYRPDPSVLEELTVPEVRERAAQLLDELGTLEATPRPKEYFEKAAELDRLIGRTAPPARRKVFRNEDVVQAFRAAVSLDVNRTIAAPGFSDAPAMFTSTGLGRLITQFKSFMVGAHNRYLVRGLLQEFDATTVQGLATMVALGYVREAIGQYAAGNKPSEWDQGSMLLGAIDRSGVLGFYGLAVGLGGAARSDNPSRYVNRSVTSMLSGPWVGTIENIGTLSGAVATGDLRPWDDRWLRLVPYNDTLKLRRLLEAEEVLPASRER